jgi:hypothetical protein
MICSLGYYVSALLLVYCHFLMHGFALLFCVFPVMWTVFYACCEVYRLLAFGHI